MLYIQGEAASGKITMLPPSYGRTHHVYSLFCSPFNVGAVELGMEVRASNVFSAKTAALTHTTDIAQLSTCEHMLVLLDARTWTSGQDTAQLVEHIHCAMRAGVHMICAHEFPSVVGPSRHECEFDKMVSPAWACQTWTALIAACVLVPSSSFDDDWTPSHLTRHPTNLYSEAALTLKGLEWRKPGLVAVAAKLAASAGQRLPIQFEVSEAYKPKAEPNPWTAEHASGDEMFPRLIEIFPQAQQLPIPGAPRSEEPEMSRRTSALGPLSV
jgi:hypothetical protein